MQVIFYPFMAIYTKTLLFLAKCKKPHHPFEFLQYSLHQFCKFLQQPLHFVYLFTFPVQSAIIAKKELIL